MQPPAMRHDATCTRCVACRTSARPPSTAARCGAPSTSCVGAPICQQAPGWYGGGCAGLRRGSTRRGACDVSRCYALSPPTAGTSSRPPARGRCCARCGTPRHSSSRAAAAARAPRAATAWLRGASLAARACMQVACREGAMCGEERSEASPMGCHAYVSCPSTCDHTVTMSLLITAAS
jgi:hypothetical protein